MTFGKFAVCCLALATGVYGGVTFYPRIFFNAACGYKNISVYAHAPVKCSADGALGRIYNSLASDEFFDPEQSFELYLCGSYEEYGLLAPFCGKSYSCVHPVSSKIFVASADFGKNLAYGQEPGSKRLLENVVVHELVKAQLKYKLGPIKYITLPDWKKDGYADHVARETEGDNAPDICATKKPEYPLSAFLEYRLVLEMLKAGTDVGYPALILENNSYSLTRDRAINKYCQDRLTPLPS